MVAVFQASLLDADWEETAPGPLGATVRRTALAHGAWVDVRPGWLRGADALFDPLLTGVAVGERRGRGGGWRAERGEMYAGVPAFPPLLCFYGEDEPLPDPALDAA